MSELERRNQRHERMFGQLLVERSAATPGKPASRAAASKAVQDKQISADSGFLTQAAGASSEPLMTAAALDALSVAAFGKTGALDRVFRVPGG